MLGADSVDRVRELAIEKELQNETKHQELVRNGSVDLDGDQNIGAALHHYNYDGDSASLSLLEAVLNCSDGESKHALSVLNRLKLDAKTALVLYNYAVNEGSTHRSNALVRLSAAPGVDGIKQSDLLKIEELFKGIESGSINYGATLRIKSASAYQRFRTLLESRGENEVKDPAEVKPVEVAEETPEQSSQLWLWLVSALVVLGGLTVVLRRKS